MKEESRPVGGSPEQLGAADLSVREQSASARDAELDLPLPSRNDVAPTTVESRWTRDEIEELERRAGNSDANFSQKDGEKWAAMVRASETLEPPVETVFYDESKGETEQSESASYRVWKEWAATPVADLLFARPVLRALPVRSPVLPPSSTRGRRARAARRRAARKARSPGREDEPYLEAVSLVAFRRDVELWLREIER